MKYTKTEPEITYAEFYSAASPVKHFKSLTGKEYDVISVKNDIMTFVRKATGEIWSMSLKGVHQAYLTLIDFKTANFKAFVPRTHSPALGLLLHIGLLIKN
ncbi:hypothetical protein [Sphingobacterium haloxyli]|uniref:Uncharacterized protein n=1 Tax=Sphingobacterium haloxyli TaxID=2100533 RepID=A0A2S9J5G8_9SPHI|nr:hypothetical protein [Sphingobacterium haloxyli]PRD48021.1 hypothetical protein C5745_05780 [Sphingobacterium haloxyli]